MDKNGDFKASREYRSTKEDFVVLEEVTLEIEVQYQRFVELIGREPEYFEGHAVMSENYFKGLELVAARHNLKYSSMSLGGAPIRVGQTDVYISMDSMTADYNPSKSLKHMVSHAHEDACDMMICHPGYLDAYILKTSSLTIPRTQEVEMLCDPAVKEWLLSQKDVALITYNDL